MVVKGIKKSPWKGRIRRLNNLPDIIANQGQSSSYNSVFPISRPLLTVKAHWFLGGKYHLMFSITLKGPGGNKEIALTFDNLLCTRIVNLLLGRAGGQYSVEDIRFPLLKKKDKRKTGGQRKHIKSFGVKSTNWVVRPQALNHRPYSFRQFFTKTRELLQRQTHIHYVLLVENLREEKHFCFFGFLLETLFLMKSRLTCVIRSSEQIFIDWALTLK